MPSHYGYYSMYGPPDPAPSTAPELVADPSFSGGYAFESFDPSTGDPSRHAVDWGSLKTIDWSAAPPVYKVGALMLGHGGEIFRSEGGGDWSPLGTLYGGSAWSDPAGTGGALSGSLPAYTAPSTPLFPSTPLLEAGMYSTSPAPGSTAPVYHSIITGTFDPTPAEIIAAAAAAGTPLPSGMDPVEYSRLMSGLSPIPMPAPTSSVPPLGSPSLSSPPLASLPTLPTSGSLPSISMSGASSGVSGSPFSSAMKTLSFDGGGGLLCDPITGKCPPYR